MKVGQIDSAASTAATAAGNKPSATVSADKNAAEPSAKVEISQAGNTMSSVSPDDSFDSAKVDRIASAIRDGKFTINAEAIADKLIINARELMGTPIPV